MLAHLTLAAIVADYRRHQGCSDEMFEAMLREWAAEVYTPEDTLRAMGFPDARWEEALPAGTFTKAEPPHFGTTYDAESIYRLLRGAEEEVTRVTNRAEGPLPCSRCKGKGHLPWGWICGVCKGSGIAR